MNNLSLFFGGLLALGLLTALVTDFRSHIIPNWLNLALALGAPLWWWAQQMSLGQIGIQVLMAAFVFALFIPLFMLDQVGGGDIKLITVLALWFAPLAFYNVMLATALVGAVVTIAAWAYHKRRRKPGNPKAPYGIAIAIGALSVLTPMLGNTIF